MLKRDRPCGIHIAIALLFLTGGGAALPADTGKDSTTAGKPASEAWDISAPHGPSNDLTFDTDEGTWISVDVSPDGKKISFTSDREGGDNTLSPENTL